MQKSFRPALALTAPAGELALAAFEQEVARKFGSRAPLSRIQQDRLRRVAALQRLCRKYQIVLPTTTPAKLTLPAAWPEVVRQETELLLENLRLYNRLLEEQTPYPDVEQALRGLRRETLRAHLPLVIDERWG